jgi:MFS family permease
VAGAAQLPFLLAEHGIRSPVQQSLLIGALTLGTIFGSLAFAYANAWMRLRRVFAAGLATSAVGIGTLASTGNSVVLGIGAVTAGIGIGLYLPYLWTVVAQRTSDAARARAFALLGATTCAGSLLNPPLMRALALPFGLAGSFMLLAALLAGGAILATLLKDEAKDKSSGV